MVAPVVQQGVGSVDETAGPQRQSCLRWSGDGGGGGGGSDGGGSDGGVGGGAITAEAEVWRARSCL